MNTKISLEISLSNLQQISTLNQDMFSCDYSITCNTNSSLSFSQNKEGVRGRGGVSAHYTSALMFNDSMDDVQSSFDSIYIPLHTEYPGKHTKQTHRIPSDSIQVSHYLTVKLATNIHLRSQQFFSVF